MNGNLVRVLAFVVGSVGTVSLALASPPFSHHTHYGELKMLGNGEIQTFVTVLPQGTLRNIGVYFTEELLENLPTEESDGHWDVTDDNGNVVFPCCGHEVVLDFPITGEELAFKHFVLNWNPNGHPPPRVYDVPHFDFHFYLITNEERMSIPPAPLPDQVCWIPNGPGDPFCGNKPDPNVCHPVLVTCETYAQAVEPLPAEQVPPGYISVGAVEPAMGNHLLDPTAPEFQGVAFTKTWIYGSFGGRLTFLEPMITVALLEEAKRRSRVVISTPDAFPEAGWYPTEYSIYYLKKKKAYVVALERMAFFD